VAGHHHRWSAIYFSDSSYLKININNLLFYALGGYPVGSSGFPAAEGVAVWR
jgi:hypothetical protein